MCDQLTQHQGQQDPGVASIEVYALPSELQIHECIHPLLYELHVAVKKEMIQQTTLDMSKKKMSPLKINKVYHEWCLTLDWQHLDSTLIPGSVFKAMPAPNEHSYSWSKKWIPFLYDS